MLTTLCIEHFTIVKRMELDFTQGMTAFTGETGAGKSVMIDALMLALGGKADSSLIRPGENKCDISAGFHFDKDSELALWLAEHDISCEDQEVFLRRILYTEGRSKSYINGQPFPLQKVKELGEKLVHLHGQHQHHALMQHHTHRQQLDQYADHKILLLEVNRAYKQVQQSVQQINHLLLQEQQSDRMHLLQFQIEELETLDLQIGEIDSLHQDHQILHHAKEYLECSQHINELLNGEGLNVCSGLNQTMQLIQQLPPNEPHIKNIKELLNGALIQCEEAFNEMQQFAERVHLDPERLQQIETRMSTIHHLARKYHIDSKELLAHQNKLQAELALIQDTKSQLVHLQLQLAQNTKGYEQASLKLRESRIAHGKKLAKEITAHIQQLGMPKGWVEIVISPLDTNQAHGLDKVEYKVCTNPGMKLDALHKVASGGELSRIGLAIQMITAQRGATPTLLFDEVDVGIGGSTAALVGQMLKQLGERLQVFCVTHQPQVAAYAHCHFRVDKQSDANQTMTYISFLKDSERIEEIARMLGGITITEQTLSHAKELLKQSDIKSKMVDFA